VLPESPRWLLAMGKQEELLKVLQKGAAANKRPAPVAKQFQASTDETSASSGFLDLFRTAHIRRISLLLYVIWFTLYLVYYGLMLNLGNMAGDLYLNVVVAGRSRRSLTSGSTHKSLISSYTTGH
jgi:OCT family organic cation transporter-like MFS transporter 4/5